MKDAVQLTGQILKQRVTRRDLYLAIVAAPAAIILFHIVAEKYSDFFVPLVLATVIGLPAAWLVFLHLRMRRVMRNIRVIQFNFSDKAA